MVDSVLIDEIRLHIRVPSDLNDAACDVIRRILESQQFPTALLRAVHECIRVYPEFTPVRLRISV